MVGGVNHCRIHCCLAKFRGFMYQGKYDAVIGFRKSSLEIIIGHIHKNAFLGQSQRRILPWYIKPRNFAKQQCKLQ
jgi:hypothetical protein